MAESPGSDDVYTIAKVSTPEGLQAAIKHLERCASTTSSFADELRRLLSFPATLAFILSSQCAAIDLRVLLFLLSRSDPCTILFKGGFDSLYYALDRDILGALPEDEGAYHPTDGMTYLSSIAKDFLTPMALYFSTLALPTNSGIDDTLYRNHNFHALRLNLAIEVVVLVKNDDRASATFSWEAATRAYDDLRLAQPQTVDEAEGLQQQFVFQIRDSLQVC